MPVVGYVLILAGARESGGGETDGEAGPTVECAEATDEDGYAERP